MCRLNDVAQNLCTVGINNWRIGEGSRKKDKLYKKGQGVEFGEKV